MYQILTLKIWDSNIGKLCRMNQFSMTNNFLVEPINLAGSAFFLRFLDP